MTKKTTMKNEIAKLKCYVCQLKWRIKNPILIKQRKNGGEK